MKKIITILTLLLVFSLSANAAQCKAKTHAGKQCSRTAVVNGYCKQHYNIKKKQKNVRNYDERVKPNYNNNGKPEKAANDTERCRATTKKGTRCKLKVVNGTRYCPVHIK